MNLTRKIASVMAALVVSLGVVAISAPAHADTSWGMRSTAR